MRRRRALVKNLAWWRLKQRLGRMAQPDGTFFMIVMSGGLHIARLAIHYIPPGMNLVVIGNGFDRSELEWAQRKLPVHRVVGVRPTLEHHEVLDALFAGWQPSFGIVDYDCFVLDASIMSELQDVRDPTLLNCIFFRENEESKLRVPETFLLFFNAAAVRALMTKYGATTAPVRWDGLPLHTHQALDAVGISASTLPESHKPYFDTLRLLMMLGLSDGYPYRFVAEIPVSGSASDRAFHVGGVSDPRSNQGIWALRGSYFWRKALESCDEEFLKSHYHAKFGWETAQELLDVNRRMEDRISADFLDFCNRVIACR